MSGIICLQRLSADDTSRQIVKSPQGDVSHSWGAIIAVSLSLISADFLCKEKNKKISDLRITNTVNHILIIASKFDYILV